MKRRRFHNGRPVGGAALIAAVVTALAALPGSPAPVAPEPAAAASKCGNPGTLAPRERRGDRRYTVMIRVNKLVNAEEYASTDPEIGLRPHIRRQDIFVINTRYKNSDPAEWDAITALLRSEFPCNRLFALNGLRADSQKPGYRYALAGHPGIHTVILDWERDDWIQAKKDTSGLPSWTLDFGKARRRIAKRVGKNGRVSAAWLPPAGRRVGVAPTYYSNWEYGLFARAIDVRNRARRKGRRGYQIVQIQNHCGGGEDIGYRAVTAKLLRQYKPRPRIRFKVVKRKGKKRKIKIVKRIPPRAPQANLGVEISFSNTPDPSDPRPVARVPASKAAMCTRAALKRGAGAFLYWASPDSMGTFFDKPVICVLRPPNGNRSAC